MSGKTSLSVVSSKSGGSSWYRSLSSMELSLSTKKRKSAPLGSSKWGSSKKETSNVTPLTTKTKIESSTPGSFSRQQTSYELIKSTQSLIERLQLKASDIRIQAVHPSIIGQDTWFQITYAANQATRYFSCQSTRERDEWIHSLKRAIQSGAEERRHVDSGLNLAVLEIKDDNHSCNNGSNGNGGHKDRRYFVEVHLDERLYARTSSQRHDENGGCFWGEHFTFVDLPPHTDHVVLTLHKEKGNGGFNGSNKRGCDTKKWRTKVIGRLRISVSSLLSRYEQEKWHRLETVGSKSRRSRRGNDDGLGISIRVKGQYRSMEVLPLRDYEPFLYFLKDEYKSLSRVLEPLINVKVKEELSTALIGAMHVEEMADDVLAEIVVDEIAHCDNEHLTFRGNSIATKAMEAYMKLVAPRYLQSTLQSVITEVILSDVDLEVDPVKVASVEELRCNRDNLRTAVNQVWRRISQSHSQFPLSLQRCFHKIRQYLDVTGKSSAVGDTLISSCIFLRYLCPAILSPSLFGLTDSYPSQRANRNLTLVAKALQTLANLTTYAQGKEAAMHFLNPFLELEASNMRHFLRQISGPVADDAWMPSLLVSSDARSIGPTTPEEELGRHLSVLHTILNENVSQLSSNGASSKLQNRLRQVLDEINEQLKRPCIPCLEQISQPTMTTLRQQQQELLQGKSEVDETSNSNTTTTTTSRSFLWSWTLPKKKKETIVASSLSSSSSSKTNASGLSHPAPHHHAWLARPDPVSGSSSNSSPSSPLKKSGGVVSPEEEGIKGMTTKTKTTTTTTTDSQSHFSLDSMTDTSSEDSTYSSQYPSSNDANPMGALCLTLPRTNASQTTTTAGNRTLSDYEREIVELRQAMHALQLKLAEAERKLEQHQSSPSPSSSPNGRQSSKDVVDRLESEEDKLRRFHNDQETQMLNGTPTKEEEEQLMWLQKRKLTALDRANATLENESRRLETTTTTTKENGTVVVRVGDPQRQRSVDELLDLLHSTPI